MKFKFSAIVLFVIFVTSCTKDTPVESEFTRLKNAHLDIPTSLDFSFAPKSSLLPVTCTPEESKIYLPEKQWISGSFDYFDEFKQSECYVLNKGCEAIDANHLKEIFAGQIMDINSNSIVFDGWVIVDISTASGNPLLPVNGEIQVTNGTGRFDGVSGSIRMNGNVSISNGIMNWKGDGFTAYK